MTRYYAFGVVLGNFIAWAEDCHGSTRHFANYTRVKNTCTDSAAYLVHSAAYNRNSFIIANVLSAVHKSGKHIAADAYKFKHFVPPIRIDYVKIDGRGLKGFFGNEFSCELIEYVILKQENALRPFPYLRLVFANPQKLGSRPGSRNFGLSRYLINSFSAKMPFNFSSFRSGSVIKPNDSTSYRVHIFVCENKGFALGINRKSVDFYIKPHNFSLYYLPIFLCIKLYPVTLRVDFVIDVGGAELLKLLVKANRLNRACSNVNSHKVHFFHRLYLIISSAEGHSECRMPFLPL